ncbi:hypothetical protein BDY21DRAFT_355112 [Lineolata rhizophorae]|uniref:C2H2-type domain-containing protein n=1 Tax=Lineolata rhizophorae TaxID=578093 RepID=A0A6A6NQX3_9PEZI|nr:hypothetical protein BDY21DRAFT_355112 [Lineolata rhizophorae]
MSPTSSVADAAAASAPPGAPSEAHKGRQGRKAPSPYLPGPVVLGIPTFERDGRSVQLCPCTFSPDCGAQSPANWGKHEKGVHLKREEWVCELCRGEGKDQRYYRYNNLTQHLKKTHKVEGELPRDRFASWKRDVAGFERRSWDCGACQAYLSTWDERVLHVRMHIQESRGEMRWLVSERTTYGTVRDAEALSQASTVDVAMDASSPPGSPSPLDQHRARSRRARDRDPVVHNVESQLADIEEKLYALNHDVRALREEKEGVEREIEATVALLGQAASRANGRSRLLPLRKRPRREAGRDATCDAQPLREPAKRLVELNEHISRKVDEREGLRRQHAELLHRHYRPDDPRDYGLEMEVAEPSRPSVAPQGERAPVRRRQVRKAPAQVHNGPSTR